MITQEEFNQVGLDLAAVSNEGHGSGEEMTMGEDWIERRGVHSNSVKAMADLFAGYVIADDDPHAKAFDLFIKAFGWGLECGRRTMA